jgi:hypothetical protein
VVEGKVGIEEKGVEGGMRGDGSTFQLSTRHWVGMN